MNTKIFIYSSGKLLFKERLFSVALQVNCMIEMEWGPVLEASAFYVYDRFSSVSSLKYNETAFD